MDPQAKNPKRRSRLICLCNAVPQDVIEAAIKRGCTTLGKIFDGTTAGVGPCGGSCQPVLRRMLDQYLRDGTFPLDRRPATRKRKRS